MLLKLLILCGLLSTDRIHIHYGKIIAEGKNEVPGEWKPIAQKLLVPLRKIIRRKKNDKKNAKHVIQRVHKHEAATRQLFAQLEKNNLENVVKTQEYNQSDLRNKLRTVSLLAHLHTMSLNSQFHPNISQRNESFGKEEELTDIENRSIEFRRQNDSVNDQYNSTKELLLNIENILENDDFTWELRVLNEELAKNSDSKVMQKLTSTKNEQEGYPIFKRKKISILNDIADEITDYFLTYNLPKKQNASDLQAEKFNETGNVPYLQGNNAAKKTNAAQLTLITNNRAKNSNLKTQEPHVKVDDNNNMIIGDLDQDDIREVSILSNGIQEIIIYAEKSIEKEEEPEISEGNNFPNVPKTVFKKGKLLKKLFKMQTTDTPMNDERNDESDNRNDKHIPEVDKKFLPLDLSSF